MVELKGSLNGIGLLSIVELIGELHPSGSLGLTRGAAYGMLSFDDGRLVAATFDDDRGSKALAACVVELADGDFVFIEGVPIGERTLDLGPGELQRQIRRIASGEAVAD